MKPCALLLGTALGLCGGIAAQEAARPVQHWKCKDRLLGLCGTERALVGQIDALWTKAGSRQLLALFECPSSPSRMELEDRVRMSLLGPEPSRSSTIVSREQRDDYVSLLLAVELRDGNDREPRRFDELLILRRGPDGPRALYLLQTGLDWLTHVHGRFGPDGTERAGLVLSEGARFTCPACNYHLTLPMLGHWVLYPRPENRSGHIEAVDLLALDRDLALELSLVPVVQEGLDPGDRRTRVQALMRRSSDLFGSCDGKRVNKPALVPTRLAGFEAWTCTLLQVETGLGRRFSKLFGMPHAALDYLVSIHGAAALLADEKLMRAVEDSFRLINPERDEAEGMTILRRLMKGLGSFDGDRFVVPRLGLIMQGPQGWDRAVRTGKELFQAVWDCPGSGANLQLRGLQRPMGRDWTPEALKDFVGRFLVQNRGTHEDFTYGKLAALEVGKHRAYTLDFDYVACKKGGERCGRTKGRLLLIPVAEVLVLSVGVAQPCAAQDKIFERILAAMSSLRLD